MLPRKHDMKKYESYNAVLDLLFMQKVNNVSNASFIFKKYASIVVGVLYLGLELSPTNSK